MRQKLKQLIGILLSLVMVLGMMPVMSLTAYADSAYGSYLVSENDTAEQLANKAVRFNGIEWYVIEDNSAAVNSGTLTLLAKDPIDRCAFDSLENKYSNSKVAAYLAGMTTGSGTFAGVADAIETVTVTTNAYGSTDTYDTATDVKLYLLSTEEATNLPVAVKKCNTYYYWWLRSPGDGSYGVCVNGNSGNLGYNYGVYNGLGVRPALKLDLSSVIFSSESKEFTLKPAGQPDEEDPVATEVTTYLQTKENVAGDVYSSKAKVTVTTPGIGWDADESSLVFLPGPMFVENGGPEEGELGIAIRIIRNDGLQGGTICGRYSATYEGRTFEGDFEAKPFTDTDGRYKYKFQTIVSLKSASSSSSEHNHHICENGHNFAYCVMQAPTTEVDGFAEWRCTRCGIYDWNDHDNADARETVVLSAYPVFNDTLEKNIKAAEAGATVSITTSRWVSVRRGVLEALAEKPGVTLTVNFEDQGTGYVLSVPGGDPALAGILASEDRFFSFSSLGNTYGLTAVEK